jgi:hypothetical protein
MGYFFEKALRMYDFLSNFKGFESIRNERLKILDDVKLSLANDKTLSQEKKDVAISDTEKGCDINFIKPIECVVEGYIEKYTKIKTIIKTPSGLSIGIWHHDLINPFTEIGIGTGDFVRAFGSLKLNRVGELESNAYIYGVKKYIPETKPETKDVKDAETNKQATKTKPETNDNEIKKGLDDCEETQKPPKQTPPPENNGNWSNSNGRSNKYAPTITKEGFEISDEGMHFIASMFKDKYHIKVLEASTFAMEDILVFKDGYYQRNGEKILRKELKDILGVEYTIGWYNTMYQHLKAMDYPINRSDFLQRPCTTNLLNGIFDYSNGKAEFVPRKDPNDFWDYNFDYIIPINYDPCATCPDIDETLYKILADRIERGFTDEELLHPSPELYQQLMDTPGLKEQWDKEAVGQN